MYGILTSEKALVDAFADTVVHYSTDNVSANKRPPLENVINTVACWGDTAAVRADPSLAAQTADGTRAVPETDGHHWGTVCPTSETYRTTLLERISTVGSVGALRLTTPGFPGAQFCRCETCERKFSASDIDDWHAWRARTITQFIRDASSHCADELYVTAYPDPYPGNLCDRTGLNPQKLTPLVDGFLVPLCSISYETTYWVESLARGFAHELAALDVSLTFQLSSSNVGVDRLVDVTRQIDSYADSVIYGTTTDTADVVRGVIRQCTDRTPQSASVR
ncbi:hypothetical protein [Halocatena halophila]|uniref:hypothetical protein n=1 Tax=Halocatena halophila TaxID=2814576 RepID=UPI002ED5DA42